MNEDAGGRWASGQENDPMLLRASPPRSAAGAMASYRDRSRRVSGAVWGLLMILGTVPTPAWADDIPRAAPEAQGYPLGPEDVVEISVWKEEGLKKEVLVRPDGMLSFPLVGEVQAAGRTADDIRSEVTQRLRKYLSDPVVSVTVLKVAAQKIYVIGRVNKPGEFVSGRYIDVLQALSMAGGLTPFASANDIRILRRKGTASEQVIPFRYNDVVKGKSLDQNIILKPGDVVVVP
jgi:polysaccharide export outer membrane protein